MGMGGVRQSLAVRLGAFALLAASTLLIGCGRSRGATLHAATRIEAEGAGTVSHVQRPDAWLDDVLPADTQHVFTGSGVSLAIGRVGQTIRVQVRPLLLPSPRLVLLADAPNDSPLDFEPKWSQLTFSMIGRRYRVDLTCPSGTAESGAVGDLGSITYRRLMHKQTDYFSEEMVVHRSALHLATALLGPLPKAESRVLAVSRHGRDYWATLQCRPDGRRILLFPRAMIWSNWTDEDLSAECRFEIANIDDWPDTSIYASNLAPNVSATVRYLRTEPATE